MEAGQRSPPTGGPRSYAQVPAVGAGAAADSVQNRGVPLLFDELAAAIRTVASGSSILDDDALSLFLEQRGPQVGDDLTVDLETLDGVDQHSLVALHLRQVENGPFTGRQPLQITKVGWAYVAGRQRGGSELVCGRSLAGGIAG